jgi:hypothetical protein
MAIGLLGNFVNLGEDLFATILSFFVELCWLALFGATVTSLVY